MPSTSSPHTWDLVFALRAQARLAHVQNWRFDVGRAFEASERILPAEAQRQASRAVKQWPQNLPTRLVDLPGLAARIGVARVWIKDESERCGLGSFKALGGAYAVERLVEQSGSSRVPTLVCATDGNHGRAVAWGARAHGCRCVIYLHEEVSAGRESALRALGAEIVRITGNYDDSVRAAAEAAAENGWLLVGDTADDDGDSTPLWVMAGYTSLLDEIVTQIGASTPSHVFVQTGVGGLAAAMIAAAARHWPDRFPTVITVEPHAAACIQRSLEAGRRVTVDGKLQTLMAGLSCGEVSFPAWPVLEAGVSHALSIDDAVVAPSMRVLFRGLDGDPRVISGESGVIGAAALLSLEHRSPLSASLGLDSRSRVLLINTEGASDPGIFESLVPESRETS